MNTIQLSGIIILCITTPITIITLYILYKQRNQFPLKQRSSLTTWLSGCSTATLLILCCTQCILHDTAIHSIPYNIITIVICHCYAPLHLWTYIVKSYRLWFIHKSQQLIKLNKTRCRSIDNAHKRMLPHHHAVSQPYNPTKSIHTGDLKTLKQHKSCIVVMQPMNNNNLQPQPALVPPIDHPLSSDELADEPSSHRSIGKRRRLIDGPSDIRNSVSSNTNSIHDNNTTVVQLIELSNDTCNIHNDTSYVYDTPLKQAIVTIDINDLAAAAQPIVEEDMTTGQLPHSKRSSTSNINKQQELANHTILTPQLHDTTSRPYRLVAHKSTQSIDHAQYSTFTASPSDILATPSICTGILSDNITPSTNDTPSQHNQRLFSKKSMNERLQHNISARKHHRSRTHGHIISNHVIGTQSAMNGSTPSQLQLGTQYNINNNNITSSTGAPASDDQQSPTSSDNTRKTHNMVRNTGTHARKHINAAINRPSIFDSCGSCNEIDSQLQHYQNLQRRVSVTPHIESIISTSRTQTVVRAVRSIVSPDTYNRVNSLNELRDKLLHIDHNNLLYHTFSDYDKHRTIFYIIWYISWVPVAIGCIYFSINNSSGNHVLFDQPIYFTAQFIIYLSFIVYITTINCMIRVVDEYYINIETLITLIWFTICFIPYIAAMYSPKILSHIASYLPIYLLPMTYTIVSYTISIILPLIITYIKSIESKQRSAHIVPLQLSAVQTRACVDIGNLDYIIHNEIGVRYLCEFMQLNMALENIIFYSAVERYKSLYDINERVHLAQLILRDCITGINGQPPLYAINISDTEQDNVLNRVCMSQYTADLFDSCQRTILHIIQTDIYPRFMKSNYFERYKSEMKSVQYELQQYGVHVNNTTLTPQNRASSRTRKPSITVKPHTTVMHQLNGVVPVVHESSVNA